MKFKFFILLIGISINCIFGKKPQLLSVSVYENTFKKDTYNIISIGRYAYEKDPKTIIKALKYSEYRDRIKLTLAGRGPIERKLKRQANRLYKKGIIKHQVEFGFFDIDSMRGVTNSLFNFSPLK